MIGKPDTPARRPPGVLATLKVPVSFTGLAESLAIRLLEMVRSLGVTNDAASGVYCADNMLIFSRHGGFRADAKFAGAIVRHATNPVHVTKAWRTHVLCWHLRNCLGLPGDIVEAGAADGFTPLVALAYLPAARSKPYWIYDAFDRPDVATEASSKPTLSYDDVVKRFAPYPKAKIVAGKLPDVLDGSSPRRVAFLHLDMGEATAEAATLNRFLPRMAPGAVVVANNYGFMGICAGIKPALDRVARRRGLHFLELPTGQGILQMPYRDRVAPVGARYNARNR